MDELWTCWLGEVPYAEAVDLQHAVRAARQADLVPDVLLLLEHPAVYTRGRRTGADELPAESLLGAPVVDVDRGGRATYHGPGQLVGYPIVRAGDVLAHLRALEGALVDVLAQEGVLARSRIDDGPDFTGVWVEGRKIASLGVHLQRGVTTHGFALNVDNDLAPFRRMVPCGLPGVEMTSVAAERARTGDGVAGDRLRCVRARTGAAVARALGRRQRLVGRARLEAALAVPSSA